jgi:hypothetical protein
MVIFAFVLLGLLGAAAFAFDVGMVLLDQRAQRNAADAAALGGARFLPGNTSAASTQAFSIASANGYTDGAGPVSVGVSFPSSGRIRVDIGNNRLPFFAQLFGISDWQVDVYAVAANVSGIGSGFGLHALNEHQCEALVIEGTGTVNTAGNIQVDSDCETGNAAFRVAGVGSLNLLGDDIGCNVVGTSTSAGASTNQCLPVNDNADFIGDPFSSLGVPPQYFPPDPVELVAGSGPAGPSAACPGPLGGEPDATWDAPAKCEFTGPSDFNRIYRLHPGVYPGGLNLQAYTFLLEPGIYWIGGGGFRAANARVYSVESGGTTATVGGGVLIYNASHPSMAASQVSLAGGSAGIRLHPLQAGGSPDSDFNYFVIYQARDVCLSVDILGGAADMEVRGIIYVPCGQTLVQANNGTLTTDALVGDTIRIAGNGGTINIAYSDEFLPNISMSGLIE